MTADSDQEIPDYIDMTNSDQKIPVHIQVSELESHSDNIVFPNSDESVVFLVSDTSNSLIEDQMDKWGRRNPDQEMPIILDPASTLICQWTQDQSQTKFSFYAIPPQVSLRQLSSLNFQMI
jgi:hypothetical protein